MVDTNDIQRLVIPNVKEFDMSRVKLVSDNARIHFVVTLIDDCSVTLTPDEFANALAIIFSDEFSEYCDTYNDCINAEIEKNNKYDELADFITGVNDYWIDPRNATTIIDEYTSAYNIYHSLYGIRCDCKTEIIDNFSWDEWVDACRVYECLYQIPRHIL